MSNASFLPEDYLEQKAERRTNLISLTLFAIVMVAVFAAFLVTNRQWTQVIEAQRDINKRFQDVAVEIERLQELEKQQENMLSTAALATALVERVPRSVLLWELIDRMPARLGLMEFELKSDLVRDVKAPPPTGPTKGKGTPRRATVSRPAATEEKVEAPKYKVEVRLVGLAPTDSEVSQYLTALKNFDLLADVQLRSTEEITVNEQPTRKFVIAMLLNPAVDARHLQPTAHGKRLDDSMSDELRLRGGEDG